MTSKDRVERTLNHQEADRVPRAESFWPETIPQWLEQGMPEGLDLAATFGYDICGAGWLNHEARIGFQRVVDETPEWITREDGHGAVLRYWKGKSGTPEHIAFTVSDRKSWDVHKAALLRAPIAARVSAANVLREMERARAAGLWFCWSGLECFEMAKDILGHEGLCYAMAEDPDWAADVYATLANLAVSALDHLEQSGARFDGAWIYGDIAYNHGPFCSPAMYRRCVQPAQKKQIAWFHERGLKVIYHTDGDFRPLLPAFVETGMDCLQPLEAKAGIDVRALKPEWGNRFSFMGNIDATVLLTNDRDRIEAEVSSKIPLAKQGGGYLYHSDHSIPPGVTWDSYRFLMERVDAHGRFG
ncbi:MAG TPA: uroporphyrinogen decarboxylase family protein [Armatimonadota bacterium]|jgi:uroporphyrinogen decarboxylase